MDLVILAAGEGKRFGGDKLLADIKGVKLYQYMEKIYKRAYDFDNKIIVGKDTEILDYYKNYRAAAQPIAMLLKNFLKCG